MDGSLCAVAASRGQPAGEQRAAVAATCRRLAAAGLVAGTAGNVSARAGELIAITPTGARLGELRAEQVTVVDRSGAVLAGELAPTSELELHLGAYARYDAGAVVHTHAPVATALACVRGLSEVPCVHYNMLPLGASVRVAGYETFGSSELACSVLDALQDRAAALMANHGAINLGADLDAAAEGAELLEWACTVYWRAAMLGTPRVLDAGQRRAVADTVRERGYGALRPA
jgi:L-fuculose-phosphate aldolase